MGQLEGEHGGASNFQVSNHSYPAWSSDPNLTLTLAKILNMIIVLVFNSSSQTAQLATQQELVNEQVLL